MKLKNIPKFVGGGISTVTLSDPNSNWFTRVGNHGILKETYNRLKALYDKYLKTKSEEDYRNYENAVNALNEDLKKYARGYYMYTIGGNKIFTQPFVADWQDIIKQKYGYVNSAIGNRWNQYDIQSSNPNTGDNPNSGWVPDGYWAAITQDRTPWGYLAATDSIKEYLDWVKKFHDIGIDYYSSNDVLYGRLNKDYFNLPKLAENASQPFLEGQPVSGNPSRDALAKFKAIMDNWRKKDNIRLLQIPEGHRNYESGWDKLKSGLSNILNSPNLYAAGRLAGALISNDKIYGEALKGILPTLRQTYNTHRQIVGDEATKQAYYRRAALGETKAGRAITSDLDKQLAYQMDAKRIGDELRALGDVADNQEIRRTSDESNQHQLANTQRATEVANANIASINQANSLRHNLLALKHAANWSSIDNFLQGIEYRKRQLLAENQEFDDYIFALNLSGYQYTPEYQNKYKEYDNILEKHKKDDGSYDYSDPEVIKARANWNNYLRELKIQQARDLWEHKRNRNLVSWAKSGTKIIRKKKDDLLYKSARDTIEHFRKMSKLSSDALNRKKPKIEKLAPHPKGSTRKYLLGGLAPFVVYKPIALGGETTTSSKADTSSTSKSKKESEDSDVLDMIKNLFKEVAGKGLSSDVNDLYVSMRSFLSRAYAFGEEISTEDLASMYLSQMKKLNDIQNYKAVHDAAVTKATANDAMNEFAVTEDGLLVCLNSDGKIVLAKDYNDAKEKELNPLKNSELSNLRNFAYARRTDLDAIIANGIGMTKIAQYLKSQLPTLGTSEIEGYTKKQSNDIKAGLELLLNDAPDGIYKYTEKQNANLVAAAIAYLKSILPTNMLSIIINRAQAQGIPENTLIASLVGAHITDIKKVEAMTGKAAKDSNGNNTSSNDLGDIIPAVAFFLGLGDQKTFIILDKTLDGIKIDTISAPITKDNKNTGIITLDKLFESDFGGLLLTELATIGDSLIALNGASNVLIGNRIYLAELPIDKEYLQKTGVLRPNLSFLKRIEQAREKLKQMGVDIKDPKNILTINKIYLDFNLPILYTTSSNNKLVLSSEYARFAMVNSTASEKAFAEEPNFNDGVREASKKERELFEATMKTFEGNSKYSIDNGWGPFDWGKENLYVGVIYIPMVDSTISALGGTGFKATGDEYNEIETLLQQADFARKMGFKPGGNESNLK